MAKLKFSISIDPQLVDWVDKQIEFKRFSSRSHAIEYALQQLKEKKD
ncbi:MAG: hypothetical protein H3Z53_03035 [archaeon]|nr:hypothetical protein [archaeon]